MKAISPCCYNTSATVVTILPEHPFCLFIEIIQIKPMKCLSNCDEINATICKTAPFSRKYFVSHVVSRLRIFNLLFTRITGYYLLKVFGKDNRRLAIASCTIPCQIPMLYEPHKKLK